MIASKIDNQYKIYVDSFSQKTSAFLKQICAKKKGTHYFVTDYEHIDMRKLLEGFGFMVVENVSGEVVEEIKPMPELTAKLNLKIEPFPYQKQGIQRGVDLKRVLIGDKPGLGKSLESIGIVDSLNQFPCLVICPSTLKENWQREFFKFSYRRAIILSETYKNTWTYMFDSGMADVFIVNYESLSKFFVNRIPKGASLKDIEFKDSINRIKSVIIDECHRVKDTSTRQAKLVKGITNGKEVILMLSGTPVVNNPKDLISQLAILNRLSDFGGIKKFKERYIGMEYYRELNSKLNNICFFQRQKKDVLPDLPDKTRQVVTVDITTKEEYRHAVSDIEGYLREYKEVSDIQIRKSLKAKILVSFGILKEISARGKLTSLFDHIDDIIEQGEKIVVFCNLREIASKICEKYPDAVHILGKDNSHERQLAIDRFQTDDNVRIIVCSIKAAGVGITLTASSMVDFIELPWTQADCEQCEDRCHRIGAKDNVTANYMLGANTIDEWIYNDVICGKREIANAITGSDDCSDDVMIGSFMSFLNSKRA